MNEISVVESKIVEKTEKMSFNQDENENPNSAATSSATPMLKYRPQALNHDELTEDSFFDVGSTSFAEVHKHLTRPEYMYQTTPGAAKIYRKRKHGIITCETSDTKLINLPNEIISSIFGHLNRRDLLSAGSTCMRFYEISASKVHWKNIDLTRKRLLESAFHRMISRNTQNVSFVNGVVFDDPALFNRDFALCNLVRLDLSFTKFMSSHMLNGILKRCQKLQYLAIESQIVDARTLDYIANNKDLVVLNLSSCKNIIGSSLSKIFKNCRLREISLSFCELNPYASGTILEELPSTVVRLAISGLYSNYLLDDAGLTKLVSRLPELQELEVDDNNLITSAFVTKLVTCENLMKVSLSRCYNIEPFAFVLLRKLNAINIYGNLSNNGFEYIRRQLAGVSINVNHLSTIGRSHSTRHFWGVNVADDY